jgi:TnpA family transposase
MHSINKANFAILDWFDHHFKPRFTDMQNELKHLPAGNLDDAVCEKFWIKPVGRIDCKLIEEEWPQLQRIFVTLAVKETTQSTIVKKLCTYSYSNRIKKALFEYDKLVRSIYTLEYLMNPELQRQVQRSQNRVESYHQLRAAIAEVSGRKQLTGKTDFVVDVSNECGRLIALAIIYYNAALLTRLLWRYQKEGHKRGLALLSKISPIAWQHIYLLGHYLFNGQHHIDLDEIIAHLKLC